MNIFSVLFFLILLASGIVYGSGNQEMDVQELKVPGHLVDSEWLSSALGSSTLVVIETARSLDDYELGHVPGALRLDKVDYHKNVNGINGMFPGVENAVNLLEGLGVSNSSAVIVYDGGNSLWAARVAWILAYLGHENWAVLDGGYGLWEHNGFEIEQGMSGIIVSKGNFEPDVQDQLLVSGEEVLEVVENSDSVVVDTRASAEYSGENPMSDRDGHVPGSLWVEWTFNNNDSENPQFLSSSELAEFYDSKDVKQEDSIITMCQTGVRGAHTWLALTLAGYKNVALYDGSWAEWGSDEKFPVGK